MHHIAYKFMKKPNSASRRKNQKPNEVPRPVSPAESEQTLLDRQEITRLKLENEKLKDSLEYRENEISSLKEDVQRLEHDLNTTPEQSMITENSEKSGLAPIAENGSVEGDPLCHRNLSLDVSVAHQALTSLRECFNATDPHQHTIDTLEQTMASLTERLAQAVKQGPTVSPLNRQNSFSVDSYSDIQGSYISSNLDPNHSFSRPSTKLVYYTSKSTTPFVSVIHKRLGEITLRDLKSCLDRPGLFRYHFKTLDPDYGMVKEEVVHDDDIIPGWDDRIVAWIVKVDD